MLEIVTKSDRFNSFGLKHSLEHLDLMKDKIHTLSLKEQSEYADQVTVQYVNDSNLINQIRDYSIDTYPTSIWNVTTIGNLAYTALYCHDTVVKELCCNLLEKYKESKKIVNGKEK